MSSPSNQSPPPDRSTGRGPNQQPSDRPPVSPTDPTRTQWAQPVQPPVSPTDPTLTQWQQAQPWPPPSVEPPVEPPAPPPAATRPRRGPRSLFWPGFAVGFLLLAGLSCGVLTAALGLNRLTLDDLRGSTGAGWTPMPVTPTAVIAEADPQTGDSAPTGGGSTRFAAGQSAANVTNSRVNIRLTPGYLGKAASDVIGQLEAGQTLQIVGDPTSADELTWWRVQATNGGQTVVGWVAEATASGVQILGSTP